MLAAPKIAPQVLTAYSPLRFSLSRDEHGATIHDDWQSGTHETGGHEQHQERQCQADRAHDQRGDTDLLVQRLVDSLDSVNGLGRREGGHADEDLGKPVRYQGMSPAVADPASGEAAEREPRHEAGQDRADREHRHPKGQCEHTQPQHLIDQPADAGAKEKNEQ